MRGGRGQFWRAPRESLENVPFSILTTMSADDGDNAWLFDYMMNVFRAPTWEVSRRLQALGAATYCGRKPTAGGTPQGATRDCDE